MKKIVIIGGVAAGATAAAKARRQDEFAEIHVFEKGPEISFANCGLPYYVGGEIQEQSALLLSSPKKMWERYRIHVHTGHDVLRIDRAGRVIEVYDLGANRVFQKPYDKLLIATGTRAVLPAVPGLEGAANVSFLRTVADAVQLERLATEKKLRSVVVLGGGFIGIEAAEQLHRRGIAVHVLEIAPHILAGYDADLVAVVESNLRADGMTIATGVRDLRFDNRDGRIVAAVHAGGRLECDFVLVSAGVKPNTELAFAAGLELGPRQTIKVDAFLRTSDPDIYAAGDAVMTCHGVTGKEAWVPLAAPANFQGRIAAINMTGGENGVFATTPAVWGTSILRAGSYALARTGLNKREVVEAGLKFFESTVQVKNHASYYPGAEDLIIKLLVEDKSGRVLGAQVLGAENGGVDKQIDVIATAMQAGMTVTSMQYLQLAYSPPYGVAKNPVNVAAMVAANRLSKAEEHVSFAQMQADPQARIVDLRTTEERTEVVAGSIAIPLDDLREAEKELPPTGTLFLYCKGGLRGYLAYRILKQRLNRSIKNVDGGFEQIRRLKTAE